MSTKTINLALRQRTRFRPCSPLLPALLLASGALSACVSTAGGTVSGAQTASLEKSVISEAGAVGACRGLIETGQGLSMQGLDGSNIRLVSWNIHKKAVPDWQADYGRLAKSRDLILLQEASLRTDTINDLPILPYWSFAPGYRTHDSISGVLTLSSVQPLSRCSFANSEPLLRTPKATSITQFALTGSDQTLLVVNVHAVNFSLGLGTYKKQFQQIEAVLEGHVGPIILSGDFNTWRSGRMDTIEALAADLDLLPLVFADDQRSRIFGMPIDHIYLRGFSKVVANTSTVTSSDHNPLVVTLSL